MLEVGRALTARLAIGSYQQVWPWGGPNFWKYLNHHHAPLIRPSPLGWGLVSGVFGGQPCLTWACRAVYKTILNPADPEVPNPPPRTPVLCPSCFSGGSLCPQVWLRPPGSLSSLRPTDFPFSPIPSDGLVKRLEELERTAELYKGGQCTSGRQPCGG